MPATPNTRSSTKHHIHPPPSKDIPLDPRRTLKRKASNESIASVNAPLPLTSTRKKEKGVAGKRAKSEATVHDVSDDEPEETAGTKPKAGAKSNIVVVPRRKNTAQSQKLELNDVVDTDRLAGQVLEYLNERVKKGAPRDSKVFGGPRLPRLGQQPPVDRPKRVPLGTAYLWDPSALLLTRYSSGF
ncbi:hypothetical protein B0H14DRAFT_2630947 [Mycena olivaceomarginata]|nr:hypothetical protein B0H14DRAFT_2630947 [Mycena olivaceomarginata]